MKRRGPEQEPGFTSPEQDEIDDEPGTQRVRVRRRMAGGSGGGAWFAWTCLAVVLVAGGLGYFWFVGPIAGQLRQSRAFLAEANANVATLQAQVQSLKTDQANLIAARDALQTTLDQREQALETLQRAHDDLAQKLQQEITKVSQQPPPTARGHKR